MAAMHQASESTFVVAHSSDVEFTKADGKDSEHRAPEAVPCRADSVISAVCNSSSMSMSPPCFCVDEGAATFVNFSKSRKEAVKDGRRSKKTYSRV